MRRLLIIASVFGFMLLQPGPDIRAQGFVDPVFTGPSMPSVEWQARYDPPWFRNDSATHVLVSPDGATVFVTGTSIGSGADGGVGIGLGDADWDFVTLAYDAESGVQLWENRYHGHQRGDGWTNSMAIAPDGGTVLVNGRSNCMGNEAPGNATVAYDAVTGDELWIACFDGCLAFGDFGTELAVSGDGGTAILVGTHENGDNGYDFATIALDMQTGEQLWVSHYDNGLHDPDAFPTEPIAIGTDPTYDSPRALAVDPSGAAVYVTGESRGHYGLVDYVTIAYDVTSGAQKGIARFDGDLQRSDRAFGIAVSPNGGQVFVTGESPTSDVGLEVMTIAYDASLRNEQWIVRHNTTESAGDASGTRDDIGRMIAVSGDGQTVIVGGDSWGSSALDWILMVYDAATGEQRWTGLYDGVVSHADFYRGLAIDEDASTIFATGHSCWCGTSGIDILTMAIRVDGPEAMSAPTSWAAPRKNGRRIRGSAVRY